MKKIILIALTATTLAGCQEKSTPTVLDGPKVPVVKDMQESQERNGDGTAIYTTREIPPQSFDSWNEKFQKTDLERLPVSSVYNISLYKIQNVTEFQDVAFVAPKLFAYRTSDGVRVALSHNDDGTVTIPFPVILVDGFRTEVEGFSQDKKTNLPVSFLVQKQADLQKELGERFKINYIAPLDGCPKQFVINVGDRQYDVTPSDLARADHCELNKPFNLYLRVKKEEARFILQEALYANSVDIRGVYQTRVTYTVAEMSLSFDKQKVYSELRAQLNGKYKFLVEVDLRVLIRKILNEQSINFRLKGEYTQQMEKLVSDVLSEFFVPMKADPEMPIHDCQSGMAVCFTMNSIEQKEQRTFHIKWEHSTTAMTGQTILTTTKLQPLNSKQQEIGDVQGLASASTGEPRPLAKNDGPSIETFLTVMEGDYLEITPSYLNVETFSIPNAPAVITQNPVCLESQEEKYNCQPRLKDRANPLGWQDCQIRIVCLRSEDQWIETTIYSLTEGAMAKHLNPAGQFEQLAEGLHLKFTMTEIENGSSVPKEVVCPLNVFQRQGDGSTLSVRIENRPGCEIFKPNRNQPMLHFINRIQFPVTYKKGKLVRNWKEETVESPTIETFHPAIEFSGILRIRGYEIDSKPQ